MPDATSNVTVDGVEPSISVKLLNIADNPSKVKIFDADDGTERWLVKENEEPILITPNDLGILGPFGIEVINTSTSDSPQDSPDSGIVKLPPAVTPTGQSSPQVSV